MSAAAVTSGRRRIPDAHPRSEDDPAASFSVTRVSPRSSSEDVSLGSSAFERVIGDGDPGDPTGDP